MHQRSLHLTCMAEARGMEASKQPLRQLLQSCRRHTSGRGVWAAAGRQRQRQRLCLAVGAATVPRRRSHCWMSMRHSKRCVGFAGAWGAQGLL